MSALLFYLPGHNGATPGGGTGENPPPAGPYTEPVAGYLSNVYGDEWYDYNAAAAVPDDLSYKAFAVLAKTDDGTVYRYITAKNKHWGTGWAQIHKSTDGATWTPVAPISPYGNVTVNGTTIHTGIPTIGASGNRVLIGWNVPLTEGAGYQSGSYQWMDYAYSDDGGASWTYGGRVMSEYGDVGSMDKGIAALGRMVRLPSGKLLQPVYVWDYVLDAYKVIFHQSSDNGASWSTGSTIISTTGEEINETWVELVEAGTTDATTKLVAIVRSEIIDGYPKWYQRYSDDGGATWQTAGILTGAMPTGNTWPMSLLKIGPTLYRIEGVRFGDYTGPLGYYLSVRTMPASQYNTTNWSAERIITRPVTEYKGKNPQDWGYPEPMQLSDGKVLTTYYDESTFQRPTVDEYKRHRIVTINAFFNYRYEAYNSAAQPISGPTELSFPSLWLDSEGTGTTLPAAGDYLIEVTSAESATLTIRVFNGAAEVAAQTGTGKHLCHLFTGLQPGYTVKAYAAGVASVSACRLQYKKVATTAVNYAAAFAGTAGTRTRLSLTPTADNGGFRREGFDTLPEEGDYRIEVSGTAATYTLEVVDWGAENGGVGAPVRVTKEVSGTGATFLLTDMHTAYEVRLYASGSGGVSGTLTLNKI